MASGGGDGEKWNGSGGGRVPRKERFKEAFGFFSDPLDPFESF